MNHKNETEPLNRTVPYEYETETEPNRTGCFLNGRADERADGRGDGGRRKCAVYDNDDMKTNEDDDGRRRRQGQRCEPTTPTTDDDRP